MDPFQEPARLAGTARRRFEQRLDALARRPVDASVIEQLGDYLASAPAQEVARIRPIALARQLGLAADSVVSGCLCAAREGLLELHWDILCPTCRISSSVKDTLREIEAFDPVPRIACLPAELRDPISRILSRDPAERLSMGQLAEQLG